jgi:hypothetical protein
VRERVWRPTQEVRGQEHGGPVITPEVPINYEIISWIPGFGSTAEVRQPVVLKKRIVEQLNASLGRRRSGGLARTKIIPEKKGSGIFVLIRHMSFVDWVATSGKGGCHKRDYSKNP